MITLDAEAIEARARGAGRALHGSRLDARRSSAAVSAIGGGSAPGVELPTVLVAIERDGLTATALEARLRGLDPPVIARIEHDRVVLDLRTVPPEDDQRSQRSRGGV